MKRFISITMFILCLFAFSFIACTDDNGQETPIEEAGTFKYVSAEVGLRLRGKPTTDSPVLGLIPYKTKVELLEVDTEVVTIGDIEGKWNKVKWGEIIGWAFDGFLTAKPFEEETEKK